MNSEVINFVRHRILIQVSSSCALNFEAQNWGNFSEIWRCGHRIISPCHSHSNGKAETVVNLAKNS